jgi:hypothetical protein
VRKRVSLRSPVRKNRTPGSVRGASGNRRPYRDASAHKTRAMSEAISPNIIAAVVGSLTIALGWFVTHLSQARRERVAREDAAALRHLEAQIGELYGPLLGLIQETRAVFSVAQKRLSTTPTGRIDFSHFSKERKDEEAWRFFVEGYFLPLNSQMSSLVRSKMHLLEGGIIPTSFQEFLLHEAEFSSLHRLWSEKGIDSREVQGAGWPPQFEQDVRDTLNKLHNRHQKFLRKLGVLRAG